MSESYRLTRPELIESAYIFSSPHSGAHYPPDFLRRSALDSLSIRSSEDAFVDQLFAKAPEFGAPLLSAQLPRAYVDLNRAADELDPAVIEGVLRAAHNPRISSGLGVIPRVVAGGQHIYRGKLSLSEAGERLSRFWHPWHAALEGLISETREARGEAILIDCHSMPHEALEAHSRPGTTRPEIVLGDRYGASAGQEVAESVEAAFRDAGLRVSRNTPFAGAFITQAYGRPARNIHAIQIEIDRSLYMNEKSIRPHSGFDDFVQTITGVIARLTGLPRETGPECPQENKNPPLAAE